MLDAGIGIKAEIPNVKESQEIHDMLAERVKTWTEEWKHRGRAEVLHRQLARRFGTLPAWTDQRHAKASDAELDAWVDHVLDAGTLDEVFGDRAFSIRARRKSQ